MALVFTALAAGLGSTTNAATYAGTAGTPSANDLLICCVTVTGHTGGSTGVGTMSGQWTWNRLTSFTYNAGADSLYLFWALATAATATTPTFATNSGNATGTCISCVRVTGGEGANQPYVRQMKTATASTANPAITMDRAILTGNGCLGFVVNSTNSAVQFTAPTNWVEIHEVTYTATASALESASRASGETGTTITWTCASVTAWGLILLELYVAGTGPAEEVQPMGSGFFGLGGAA